MNDRKQVRRILWQWGTTMDRVRRMQAEIRDLQTLIDGLHDPSRAQDLTGMPHSTGTGDPTARAAERAMELTGCYTQTADCLAQQIKDALRLKAVIDEIVAEKLTPTQARVLEMRYHEGHGWEYIALKMSYAERLVRQRESEAADTIAERISVGAG